MRLMSPKPIHGPRSSAAHMIMRMWHGTTPTSRAEEYLALMTPRALADYRGTPGNLGAWVLTRREGDTTMESHLLHWACEGGA